MLDKLIYNAWENEPKYYVTGEAILQIADEVMAEFGQTRGNYRFQSKNPKDKVSIDTFTLGNRPIDWFEVAKWLDSNYRQEKCRFLICGRYVVKSQYGFYMCDDGGSGYKNAWDQPYIRGHGGGAYAKKEWEFDRGGPSYGQFANRLSDQQQHSTKYHSDNEAWSKAKAIKLRKVLMGDSIFAASLAQKGDLTSGQFLAVLAATMFLAEPARNRKAFLANLMLMNMVELEFTSTGGKKYTWDKIMARPGESHLKGGKLPAANTGSAGAGLSAKNANSATKPDNMSLQDWNDGLASTRDKELTIFCRYLQGATFTAAKKGVIPSDTKAIPRTFGVPAINHCPTKAVSTPFDRQILGYLKYLMGLSLNSFDYNK